MNTMKLEDFPFRSMDKLRFADTDRQGHVNNSIFAVICETGRVELMDQVGVLVGRPHRSVVIARLRIDYRREAFWPGAIQCGTGIVAIGSSSVTLSHGLFQNDECIATAESVVVQVDGKTRRSTPLDDAAKAALGRYLLKPQA